jgi:hypothetical protein
MKNMKIKCVEIALTLLLVAIGVTTCIYTKNNDNEIDVKQVAANEINIYIDVYIDGVYKRTMLSNDHSKGFHILTVQETLHEDQSLYICRWENANGTTVSTRYYYKANFYEDTDLACYLTTK